MFAPTIVLAAVLNGLLTGAIYALMSVALTLVYGVLHIINFAHGAILTAAMFAAFFAFQLGVDPLIAVFGLAPLFFALGYGVQRFIIGPASHGEDRNILLITLGLSIVIENVLLAAFRSDTRTIDVPYGFSTIDLGFVFLPMPRVIAFGVTCAMAVLLWRISTRTDTGKAIRAVAKEKLGAALVGIDVAHVYAVTFGLGAAALRSPPACCSRASTSIRAWATPMYSCPSPWWCWAAWARCPARLSAGCSIGVVESLSGLYFGESLGQLGIFLIFILRSTGTPTGLFGARA